MRWGSQLDVGLRPVVDLVYPPRCPLCGGAIAAQEGLCGDCWSLLDIPARGIAGCEEHGGVAVHAATYYNDASRRLVLAYKHGGKITLARLLARLLAARLPDPAQADRKPLLVPVPLHRWRLWQRGFNQAALLANELARLGKGEVLVDALMRQRRTPSLGGLGREARERALAGAIAANSKRASVIAGRAVVLVDDVFTSGATTRACIAALGGAGPRSIAVACFARVDEAATIRDVWTGPSRRGLRPENETPEAF
ncbi:MAG: double zinc ribbon domain-containing protein [Erythrobacteraceae bacterium]|nr:double zinc ribbon domain-containing protein [Erythrobacteraceae bacterium]